MPYEERASDHAAYCADLVRRHDPDRFLVAAFAAPPLRRTLVALAAFNLETAKIPEVVSETMMGRIRAEWWRESLDGIGAGTPREHAVVQEVAAAIARHGLDRAVFDRLIDVREDDLERETPATMAALREWIGDTAGALTGLGLDAAGEQRDEVRSAAIAATTGWALTGIARAVSAHARQNRVFLPLENLAEAGVGRREVLAASPVRGTAEGVRLVVRDLARESTDVLSPLVRHPRRVREGLPFSLLAALGIGYLKRLGRVAYDPVAQRLSAPDPWRVPRILWAARTGRVGRLVRP